MSIPDFGEGGRGKRAYRRMSLAVGAVVIALIVTLAILAVVT